MKKLSVLLILLLTCCSMSFGISMAKLNQTLAEISKECFSKPLNFKVVLLSVVDFENERMSGNMSYAEAEKIVTFVEHSRYTENKKYAWGTIYIRKEILDMSDDFFDNHYAHYIAHEFCHIYKETYCPPEQSDHGEIFLSVQKELNQKIEKLGPRYKKYTQHPGEGFYDSELEAFFARYR